MGPARSMVFGWIGVGFLNNIPFVFGQAFEGGLRPVQLFVNTTITSPQQKLESPFHILFLLGGISRISPCPAVCLQRVFGRFGHRFFVPSRAMTPFLPPYPEMKFAFWELILLCVGKGKLGVGEPWQGERVGRGNRRAGSEISHDEHVEILGIWVV